MPVTHFPQSRRVGRLHGRGRSTLQQRVDVVQNKLSAVIVGTELALADVDGQTKQVLQQALRAAWRASDLVAQIPAQAQAERRQPTSAQDSPGDEALASSRTRTWTRRSEPSSLPT